MKYIKSLSASIILAALVFIPGGMILAEEEAVFLLESQEKIYQPGDVFSLNLKLKSEKPVTSIKSYISFNPQAIQVESIDVKESILPFWWQNEFDNQEGNIFLQASTPSPGETEGLVARINLMAVAVGQARIKIDSPSLILMETDENILNLTASVGPNLEVLLLEEGQGVQNNFLVVIFLGATALVVVAFLTFKKKSVPVQ
ncbi:MAG: cohesin domain-containing protein [Candidatus Nealsonbacteria bacterium]